MPGLTLTRRSWLKSVAATLVASGAGIPASLPATPVERTIHLRRGLCLSTYYDPILRSRVMRLHTSRHSAYVTDLRTLGMRVMFSHFEPYSSLAWHVPGPDEGIPHISYETHCYPACEAGDHPSSP